MSVDKKSVTITVTQDPKTDNLIVSGDGVTVLQGNGAVAYILDDQTKLGLAWSGMSLRVNEACSNAVCLTATIDPKSNSILITCAPTRASGSPAWGLYPFYLTFSSSQGGLAGAQWSFDPVIDCEQPE